MLQRSEIVLSLEELGRVLGLPEESLIIDVGLTVKQDGKGRVFEGVKITVVAGEELEVVPEDRAKG